MAVAPAADMTPTTRHVVVAYDFSEHGHAVLDRAIALASRAPFHELHFVTALDPRGGLPAAPPSGDVDYDYADSVRAQLTQAITDAFQGVDAASEINFFVHTRIGAAADEILGLAEEVGADLIFVGTHGHTGLKHLVMGSVAERVVREARCPVMVVRPKGYPDVTLEKIVDAPSHKRPASHLHRLTYTNDHVIMRPPYWSTT
jgi:nucleotide-binding universal stress UspA family protein